MNMRKYISIILAAAFACSCTFKNDIDYPKVEAKIIAFEVDGMKSASINEAARTVTVDLEETAEISKLKITKFEVSDNAKISESVPETIDLSNEKKFTLKTYQDYVWTIKATQHIDRYISCSNQVGDAQFNISTHEAFVYVAIDQPLSAIELEDIKLEAEDSKILTTTGTVSENGESVVKTEELDLPMTLDCVLQRSFDVVLRDGSHVEWKVKFLNKDTELVLKAVNAWAHEAYITGEFPGKEVPVMEYKSVASKQWIAVENVKTENNSISATIEKLKAGVNYEVRLSLGVVSKTVSFTTEKEEQLYNSSFDDWYQDMSNSGCWSPYAIDGQRIWDTANRGTLITGAMPTIPETSDVVKGNAAHLITTEALGLLAAGNVYTGTFGKVSGLGAELDWGVPFTSRPKALKGWYKYSPVPINRIGTAANKDKYKEYLGTSDKCQIQVMIAQWDKPFHVNSAKEEFVDFENDEGVIAFGRFESDLKVDEWTEFTLPLEYKDLTTKPTYIIITACGSYLGNYYVGGTGSEMWVDEFELVY